ncbi:hypothetical protein ZTR_03062 [Talaromyces verruculosus]|nr:hypothetical protein ZTR_03062 [Talaromyces verruculosus]
MKNLLELFPPYRKRKEDEKVRRARIKISNNLFRLWNKLVLFEDDSYIDPASLEDLNIKYEDLTFNRDGLYDTTPTPNFFQPSTKEYVRGLPIDKDDEETKRCLEALHDRWIINNPQDPYETPPNGYTLCYRLRNWFQDILRKRPGDEEPVSLRDLSELKHYLDSEDRLLVAEILAFVAVMWNRLVGGDLYPERNVVPMMIFTFSNDQRGRIVQACYDSGRLVIRKSKLYDFTTEEKCTESMEIFLQQLTGSLVGPTRILDVNTTHPKTPRTIKAAKAAKASGAAVDLATRNDPIASKSPKPSNDAISAKDFATSNAPSSSDIPVLPMMPLLPILLSLSTPPVAPIPIPPMLPMLPMISVTPMSLLPALLQISLLHLMLVMALMLHIPDPPAPLIPSALMMLPSLPVPQEVPIPPSLPITLIHRLPPIFRKPRFHPRGNIPPKSLEKWCKISFDLKDAVRRVGVAFFFYFTVPRMFDTRE